VRRDSLTDLAKRREGSLDEAPFGAVLLAQCLEQRSIALELRCRNIHKTVLLDRGVPVECRTNLVRETLGQFLVSEGRISAFQCKESLAEAAERGLRIGAVLIERGFLDPLDLPGALQRNLGRRLLECFTWQKGDYRLLPELPKTTPTSRINVARLAFTGLSRYTALEQMLAWVGPLPKRPLFLHHQPPVGMDDLRLPPTLRNVITTLRREQSLQSLLARSTLSSDELVRSLAALAVMEVIVVRRASTDVEALDEEIQIDLEEESFPEEEERPYESSDRELSPEEAFRLRNEITVEHMTLARKGAYEVLGVTADTPKTEVRRRYVELVEHYAPARYETSELRSVAHMADDLLRATVTAYREIVDPQRGEPGAVPTDADVARHSTPPILEGAGPAPIEEPESVIEVQPTALDDSESALQHLARIDGPGARFLYASIAFSLGDDATAHDEFLRGCSLWAERSDRAEDVEPSEASIT
jgi:DnaJ-domain-containing protein 1